MTPGTPFIYYSEDGSYNLDPIFTEPYTTIHIELTSVKNGWRKKESGFLSSIKDYQKVFFKLQ